MISSVRAFHIGGEAAPEVASARGSFSERHGVLLELCDADGAIAFGEASPLPGFSRESLQDVSNRVVSFPWASLAVPREVAELGALSIEEASLRFAVEHALMSLSAQQRRSTVAELLADGSPQSIATSVLLGSIADPALLERASGALARRAASLKVKVNARDLEQLRERVLALRAAVGPSVEIRIDFNGTLSGLTREEIVGALEPLAQANIAFVEEPWNGARLLELGVLPLPWFADESLADPALCAALEECAAAGGFVLKPSLLGLLGAWNIGLGAAAEGRQITVSHLFEGSVALAGCAELGLALATTASARVPGLDRHAALACFDLPAPPELASDRAEITRVSFTEQEAFIEAVREQVARERPFFEWTA